jgi:TatD DNase family protein
MIIDTHAHLMFQQFNGEVDAVIERAKAARVEKIINIGCNKESSRQAHEMSLKYEGLYATLGLHPYDALEATDELMEQWAQLIEKNKKIVAIGECGLDYFKAKVGREDQKKAFIMQLKLAHKVGLPVVIHNRDSDEDCLQILKEFEKETGDRLVAVFHCYGSDVQFARKLLYEGYYMSFTGVITYPNAEALREVVAEVPMDMFMVETDCPYLAPQSHRGERNEPAYVVDVVEKIAEIKGIHVHEIQRISTQNAQEFFRI